MSCFRYKILTVILLLVVVHIPVFDSERHSLFAESKKSKPDPKSQKETRKEKGYPVYLVANGVRMRSLPGTKGKILGYYGVGTEGIVLERTGKREKIGKATSHWYKLRIGEKEGWIFGNLLYRVEKDSDILKLAIKIRTKLWEKLDPSIPRESSELYKNLWTKTQDKKWKTYYRYMQLVAVQSVLKNTPFEAQNQPSNPFQKWLAPLKENQTVFYNEPAGIHILNSRLYWDLANESPDHPLAEEIRYSGAVTMLGGECEGYVPCHLSSMRITYLEYLKNHPNGKYSGFFMKRIAQESDYINDSYMFADKKDKEEYSRFLETLDECKLIVEKIKSDPHKEKILRKWEELRNKT